MSCTDYKLVKISEVYTISNCTATNDTVCSRCEVGLVWSSDLSECVRCGPCCSNSVVYLGCSPDHGDPTMACVYDAACAGDKVPGLNSTGDVGWYQITNGQIAKPSHLDSEELSDPTSFLKKSKHQYFRLNLIKSNLMFFPIRVPCPIRQDETKEIEIKAKMYLAIREMNLGSCLTEGDTYHYTTEDCVMRVMFTVSLMTASMDS